MTEQDFEAVRRRLVSVRGFLELARSQWAEHRRLGSLGALVGAARRLRDATEELAAARAELPFVSEEGEP